MVDIIGRAKIIAETIIDEQQAKKAGKKAGEKAADGVAEGGNQGGTKFSSNFETIVGKSLPLAAVGVGAAVGTALAVQIGKSIEREATGARFAASLGLDSAETAELNQSAAKIYREAWGESFEAVQEGVAATKSSFRDLTGDELTEASRAAQVFADVFGVDVVEAAGVASVAVKQGLAVDAVEAFDLMTAAAQQVPIQFRDELLEAVTEYSSFFESLGIEGPEAFALLAQGAELGQYGIDKVGDSIKEFQIRVLDTSATTTDAFTTLGLNMADIQTAIASGGDEAEAAFRDVVNAIAAIEDPVLQAQTAIALFGTPLEDLSQEELPAFIDALATGTLGLTDFEGAAERSSETAGATFSSQISSMARSLDVILGDAITKAIEKLGDFNDAVRDSLPGNSGTIIGGDTDKPFDPDDFINRITGRRRASGGPAGGLTLVGEEGPELVDLPGGSYVFSNEQSRQMASSAGVTIIHNNYGPVTGSQQRQETDWSLRYGSRFGSAAVGV